MITINHIFVWHLYKFRCALSKPPSAQSNQESVGIENGGPLIAPVLIGNEVAYAILFFTGSMQIYSSSTTKNMHFYYKISIINSPKGIQQHVTINKEQTYPNPRKFTFLFEPSKKYTKRKQIPTSLTNSTFLIKQTTGGQKCMVNAHDRCKI